MGKSALFAPQKNPSLGPLCRERIERRLVRALVEELRMRFFFRTAHGDDVAVDELRHARLRIAKVADQDRFGRADHDARRLQPDLESMRAEITFFSRVIVRVDEDRVVRAGGDARFASDADVLVEIDDAVGTTEHGRRRTRLHAGRVIALIASRDLKGAARFGELSDVDVLDVGAIHAEGNGILRFAGGAAGMTADAAGLVDDFSPLHFGRGHN